MCLFSDIHTHLLFGTDDGAKTVEDMYAMVDAAYACGTRFICATPHFYPGYFGNNREFSKRAYENLVEYCNKKYPDLELMLGNELYYKHDSIAWLKEGVCCTLGNTRYVLVEFLEQDTENFIAEAVSRLLNAGYIPIIAHAERYKCLSLGRLLALRESGILVQVNAQSFFLRLAFGIKCRLKKLLDSNAVDFVSSDAHDLGSRSPDLKKSYKFLIRKYGEERANALCCENARKLLLDHKPEGRQL